MFMECDEIAVEIELWKAASGGDREAKAKLRGQLKGITLYVHALSLPAGSYETVTAREVCAVLGDNLTLTIGFDG
jgi:hypothetical protein